MLPLRWSKQNRIKLLQRVEETVNNIPFSLLPCIFGNLHVVLGPHSGLDVFPSLGGCWLHGRNWYFSSSIPLSSFVWILEFCAVLFFLIMKMLGEERINPSAGHLFHRAVPWQAGSQGWWLSGFLLTRQAGSCATQVAAFSLPRAGAAPVVSAACVGKQAGVQQVLASPVCQAGSLGLEALPRLCRDMLSAHSCSLQSWGWEGGFSTLGKQALPQWCCLCVRGWFSLSTHSELGECCSCCLGDLQQGVGSYLMLQQLCEITRMPQQLQEVWVLVFFLFLHLTFCLLNKSEHSHPHSYFGSCALTWAQFSQTKLLTPVWWFGLI